MTGIMLIIIQYICKASTHLQVCTYKMAPSMTRILWVMVLVAMFPYNGIVVNF